jgi:TRAP-type mannitol/chloroaromatic compound transport system substrate-binding protein
MLKSLFGDSKIGLKWIATRAMELVKKLKISLSQAFKKAWREVYVMFKNQCFIQLKLFVEGKTIRFVSELNDILTDSLEYIGEVLTDKQKYYNICKRIYDRYDEFTDIICEKSKFTFGKDIYVMEV